MKYSTPNLGPRVPNVPRSRKVKRPSEALKERMAETEQKKSLGERLSEVSMAMPEGEGMASKALKGAVSGAAAGATIGEALAEWHQARIQKGEAKKPRTMSETVMSGGEYDTKKRKWGRPKQAFA